MGWIAPNPYQGSGGLVPVAAIPWATFPAPAAVPVGTRYIASDYGYTEWVNTGSAWYPVGGLQVLYTRQGSTATPISTLTGNGAAQIFTLPEDLLLPAGMIQPGLRFEFDFLLRKAGVHTGLFLAGLQAAPNAGTIGAALISSISSSATNPSTNRLAGFFSVDADLSTLSQGQAISQWVAGTSTSLTNTRADATVATQDRYVVPGIGGTYTDSAADLLQYSVAVRGSF
jgi:hypothetical protein